MHSPRLRIAICGGGIGGLTCAIALSRNPDLQVDVYEAAAEFAEVGAGVGIWPRPWKVLESLGLGPDLLAATEIKPKKGPVPIFYWRKSDQEQGLPFYTLNADGVLLTFHRPAFQTVLLKHLPRSCSKHTSKRLRSYRHLPTGGVELLFEDRTNALCDVLIGADGIKSAVRRTMMAEAAAAAQPQDAGEFMRAVDPVWCGTVAYRAVVPAEKLRAVSPNHRVFEMPTQYLGKNSHIISYPIAQGTLINIAAFICRHDLEGTPYEGPWVSKVGREEVAGVWAGWEPEVQELISCVDKAMKWAIHTVLPLRSFVTDRVALIGDAAHAEQPTQGAGAGQAIEDAYLLAAVLSSPRTTRSTLSRALRAYDAIRRPFASEVAERSRLNARCFTFDHPVVAGVGVVSEQEKRGEKGRRLDRMSEVVRDNWKWVWSTTLERSVEDALRMLGGAYPELMGSRA